MRAMNAPSNATPFSGTSILGTAVRRVEDPKMLTSGGTFVDDICDPLLDGALHVHFVRASMAHATISVDTSEALNMPGVVAIVTAADIADMGTFPADIPIFPKHTRRPWLATDTVRFVGEPVAAILTEQRGQGPDAAEMVVVDYSPLPVVIGVENALLDEVMVHVGSDTNVVLNVEPTSTVDVDASAVVIRQRIVNSRVAPSPIEPRVGAAAFAPDGRLHHWTSSQGSHPVRDLLAKVHNLDPAMVRVVTPDVGGGFGAKATPAPEDMLLPRLAKITGRPVRWVSTRTDDMCNLAHGRAQVQFAEIGATTDGRVESYKLTVLQDSGAYPRYGAYLPNMTKLMQPGVYDMDNIEFSSKSLSTNTTPVGAFRGAGRPEASAAIERMMDMLAAELNMDPVEIRRRNLRPPFHETITTAAGAPYDVGDYEGALDRVLEAADYPALRAEQAARRASGDRKLLGIGVSCYVEVTAGGGGSEFAGVEILPNGKVCARTGSTPYGTGHETSWAMLISDRLGVPLEDIEVRHGDTDDVARGSTTGGSRSLQIAGTAIYEAAGQVASKAAELAAALLEAPVEDIVLDTSRGAFHVVGTPTKAKTWSELGAAAAAAGTLLEVSLDRKADSGTFPFGAHVAVVEVDADTGKVTLQRLVACDDAGRILNPLLVTGQVHGGLAQGAAQALLEEVAFDVDGNPQTNNFADYGVISAAELPSFERVPMETPTHVNELGAKGIGESGTIGATPAVQNAVIDAVAHLGVRHIDMPTTSEKVWRAINGL
jgi:aerobic carbon-monoxide dehydrogenase large subunit